VLTNKSVYVDSDGRPRDALGNHASAFLVGHKPEKDKGEAGGSCNRTACQRPTAVFKHSNGKYYCGQCARDINRACAGDPVWTPIVLDREALAEHDRLIREA
jgi:hypothetical protein